MDASIGVIIGHLLALFFGNKFLRETERERESESDRQTESERETEQVYVSFCQANKNSKQVESYKPTHN